MKDDHPKIVPQCRSAVDSSVSAFILDQTSVTLSFFTDTWGSEYYMMEFFFWKD